MRVIRSHEKKDRFFDLTENQRLSADGMTDPVSHNADPKRCKLEGMANPPKEGGGLSSIWRVLPGSQRRNQLGENAAEVHPTRRKSTEKETSVGREAEQDLECPIHHTWDSESKPAESAFSDLPRTFLMSSVTRGATRQARSSCHRGRKRENEVATVLRTHLPAAVARSRDPAEARISSGFTKDI